MAGNAGAMSGECRVRTETSAEEMLAFDQLPADLRKAIAHAKFEWPSGEFLRQLNGGRYSERALINMITSYEAAH